MVVLSTSVFCECMVRLNIPVRCRAIVHVNNPNESIG